MRIVNRFSGLFIKIFGLSILSLLVYYYFDLDRNFVLLAKSALAAPYIYLWFIELVFAIVYIITTNLLRIKTKSGGEDYLINELSLIQQISAIDPQFDPIITKNYIQSTLMFIQESITNKTFDSIRGVTTSRFLKHLKETFPHNQTYAFKFGHVRDVVFVKVVEDENFIGLYYQIVINEIYYELDSSGDLMDGDREIKRNTHYLVSVIKRKNAMSKIDHVPSYKMCPNCNVNLTVDNEIRCIHCREILNSGKFGFVFDSIMILDDKTSQFNYMYKKRFKHFGNKKKQIKLNNKKANKAMKNKFLKVQLAISSNYEKDIKDTTEIQLQDEILKYLANLKKELIRIEQKKIKITNIVLDEIYQQKDFNYLTYYIDGLQKYTLYNSSDRAVLSTTNKNQYFMYKVVVVLPNDKELKAMSIVSMYEVTRGVL